MSADVIVSGAGPVGLLTAALLPAGDAAHVHFPADGQGVNVGMQDAVNLAWKLVAEAKGRATPLITGGAASYDRERRPVAGSLAQNTQAQTALMTTFTPQGAAMRELMSTLLARPETNAHLAGLLSGLSVSYPAPDAGHPLDGHRVPDLHLPDGDTLLRRLRVDRFLLVDFTPAGEFDELGSPTVEVVPARPWSRLAAALVRPDGHLARAWNTADAHQIRAALTDWGAPDSTRPPGRSLLPLTKGRPPPCPSPKKRSPTSARNAWPASRPSRQTGSPTSPRS
ncbi:FAD-dependent monooxygenase [Streptomyces sp. NPDC046942]|uniref:FAD-dependent monooxygenase n=1 Tax=Streptomyces sp. NPDC046942 TaxID=3155137 RepID=UPI0033DEE74F